MGCVTINIGKTISRILPLVLVTFALQACVTSPLESVVSDQSISAESVQGTENASTGDPTTFTNDGTSELALTDSDGLKQMTRAEGIEDIHRKAKAAPDNAAAPDLGNPRQGAAEIRPRKVVDENIAELNARQRASKAQLPDEELLANKRSMAELRKKASNHYESALEAIEKSE